MSKPTKQALLAEQEALIDHLRRENYEIREAFNAVIRDREGEFEDGHYVEIVSDGLSLSTNIKVDGKPIEGVRSVRWSCEVAPQGPMSELVTWCKATLELEGVKLNIRGRVLA